MHNVPSNLRGATLGKAHQWVRSLTDTREYALENPAGKRISLGDLTNGSTTEVRIIGEVKKNPAHPAAFTGRSFGMNRHVNLTHILPEEVKPALVSAMVREHGLFGAVQSLSILMSRPLKDFVPSSPMAEEILRARFYDYEGTSLPLRNPTPAPVGFGRSYGGRLLGEEIATQDAALEKYVMEAMDSIDKISITAAEMNNFVNNSLTPFLLAAEANRRAITYIRREILPVAKDLGIRGKSLDREFQYMVKHMATDPADFYHGKEFAIIAHPAFLFPQFGPMALPVPSSKSDKRAVALINDLFLNAGNAPRFEGGKFVRRDAESKAMSRKLKDTFAVQFLGDYLVGGAKFGDPLDWNFIKGRMKKFDLGGIIRALAYHTGEAVAPLASDEGAFIEAFKELKGKDRAAIAKRVAETQPASLFVMDLHGMLPRPADWPDALVLSAMEVLAKYRAGVKESDVLEIDFTTDAGLGVVEFDYEHAGATKRVEVNLADLDVVVLTTHLEAVFGAGAAPNAFDVIAAAMKEAAPKLRVSELTLSGSEADLADIMSEAVSLAITKHGYESDEDDIRFVTALMIQGVTRVRGAHGLMKLDGIAGALADLAKDEGEADRAAVDAAIQKIIDEHDKPAGAYVALLALKRSFGGKI